MFEEKFARVIRQCEKTGNHQKALSELEAMERKGVPENACARFYEAKGLLCFQMNEIRHTLECFRRALQSADGMDTVNRQRLCSNYVMYLHYMEGVTDEELRDAHFSYGQMFSHVTPFSHVRRAKENLRVGYLSSNLSDSIVVNFSVQLFSRYDRGRYEVVLYETGKKKDEVTDWLRGMVNGWRDLSELSAEEAARRIYEDEVDILFDLTGHTEGGRTLQVAAYRPAPVQLCGIGYFDTTGLPAMDYFLSDVYCDPAENDALFSERLIRLPRSHFCYTPPVSVLECRAKYHLHRPVVFGSFNNFHKITDGMLELWHEVICRVPGSRLLLKNVSPDRKLVKAMRERALRIGFLPEQLDLRPGSWKYLDEYADVDIALDTYPYPGGGTTCEALYMGVPVISLYGQRHGSRFGYSLLQNIGMGELVAAAPEEYVEKAVAVAGDAELLTALHRILRERLQQSPVMDAGGYVRDVEAAYERIWQEWLDEK
ncbi:MAG: hypothetical protein IKO94_07885 [Selenomonadaceae bacterium]|nr:hypothetical protein [Selenomonadaceae bacterium]